MAYLEAKLTDGLAVLERLLRGNGRGQFNVLDLRQNQLSVFPIEWTKRDIHQKRPEPWHYTIIFVSILLVLTFSNY